MNTLRKALVGVAAGLLAVALFGFGFTWSISRVFGTSHDIKQALQDTNFYRDVVSTSLQQAQKNQQSNGSSGSGNSVASIDNPDLRALLQKAFPQQYLQTQIEHALDNMYDWVNGKTPTLAFSIDLTGPRTVLADNIGAYVQTHLAALPACGPASSTSVSQEDVDVFTAVCVPPGYNIAEAATKARDQILSDDLLKNAQLTPETIKSDNGKTLQQQLQSVPQTMHKVRQGMFGTMILVAALGCVIVFMSSTRRIGLRRLAILVITSGIIATVLGILSSFAIHRAAQELAKHPDVNGPWQQKLFSIAQLLGNDLRFWWVGYGIVLAVLGIGALVALHFTAPPHDIHHVEPTGEAHKDEAADAEMPATDAAVKPAAQVDAGKKPKHRT